MEFTFCWRRQPTYKLTGKYTVCQIIKSAIEKKKVYWIMEAGIMADPL